MINEEQGKSSLSEKASTFEEFNAVICAFTY
jgi:hypothetical protein